MKALVKKVVAALVLVALCLPYLFVIWPGLVVIGVILLIAWAIGTLCDWA